MKTIILKNGAQAADVAVNPIMLNLRLCAEQDPIAFYELVQVCRNPDHMLFGNTGETLRTRRLLEGGGQPHDVVRDVVLSAVTGGDLDLTLGTPEAAQ